MLLKEYTISEISTMKYGKMLSKAKFTSSGFPVFSGYRITGYTSEFLYEDPEVIVVARGVGGTGDVKISPPKSWITNLSIVLCVNTDIVDKYFFCEMLNADNLKSKLDSGASISQITINSLESYKVKLPPLELQKSVSDVLQSYDHLIENNNRRIAILEEMAQSLYREWFVYFRYPGHTNQPDGSSDNEDNKPNLIDSPLGPIPEGWEVKSLGDLVHFKRNTIKKGTIPELTPYMGLEHFPRKSIALSEWEEVGEIGSNKLAFNRGDILFGKIRPNFHKVGVAQVNGLCSSDTFVLSPKLSVHHSMISMVTFSDEFVAQAVQTSQGSKMPRASWDVLKDFPVYIPELSLLEKFNAVVEPAIEQVRILSLKNRNLKKQRDMLLPKLISGDIEL